MNKLEQLGEDQRIIDQLTAALAEARAEAKAGCAAPVGGRGDADESRG